MTTAATTESHAIVVPGYTVGERIGAGGFGEVYRARHTVIGRDVAIKILHAKYSRDDEAVRRFLDEARAVNKISHPGIVEISDFGVLGDGRQYCVMELLVGMTLRDVLRERPRLPVPAALPILRGIADAVDAAHAAGIAHRDLKPDNVFVLPDGSVKLIDFGLAKLTQDETTPAVTETGAVFGTPLYMSPEQCRGKAITTATDAYSFGVLAYHVLVGEPPFSGEALELALHHLNDDPVAPSKRAPGLDGRVDRVLLALLAKDPAARPVSLRDAVDAIAGEGALPKRVRRWRWFVNPTLAVACAGAAAAAVVVSRGCVEPRRECALADDKLAGVWDASVQNRLRERFNAVNRPDVPATLNRVSSDLDRYATLWRERWEAMCADTEGKQQDPLLWAQRQACLEGVLTNLAGVTKSALGADVRQYALGMTNDTINMQMGPSDFCTNEKQLRAQKPPVPLAIRDKVVALQNDFLAARSIFRESVNAGKPDKTEVAIAQMKVIEDKLVALGQSGLFEAGWRVGYMIRFADRDPTRIPEVRAAIEASIVRAEAAQDDAATATLYSHLIWLEEDVASAPAARVEQLIEKAAVAARRSGGSDSSLTMWRARLAARDGRLADAVDIVRANKAIESSPAADMQYMNLEADWLESLGRHDEAIHAREQIVAFMIDKLGPNHQATATRLIGLARSYSRGGRHSDALATLDRVKTIYEGLGNDLGPDSRTELANEMLAARARAGQLDAIPAPDLPALLDRATVVGDLDLFTAALAHASDDPSTRAAIEEFRSFDAFVHGDSRSLETHARRSADAWNTPGEFRFANGWLTLVNALRHTDSISALRALRHSERDEGPLEFFVGISDRALGNTADAMKNLDASLASIPARRDSNLAEADAWAGAARVEAGDHARAIPALEESLAILANCCRGWHYYGPLAKASLAKALVATGGDATRAKQLADDARAGFDKLGGFWRDEIAKLPKL